jgi:hypothetical protein
MPANVQAWNLFDACCTVGLHLKLREGGLHSAEHLLAEMDHYGIAEALRHVALTPAARSDTFRVRHLAR